MSLITITGPTGSGKTLLSKRMSQIGILPLISCTTRPKRPGEECNKDYKFMQQLEMDSVPLVEMVHYGGYRYGLSEEEVLRAKTGRCCVVVNPEGREALKCFCAEHDIPILTMYVSAPQEILIRRLMERAGKGAEFRIMAAIKEHESWGEMLHHRMYTHFDGPKVIEMALGHAIDWNHNCDCIEEAGS